MTDNSLNYLFNTIVDRINMGIVVVDINCNVVLWNRFMSSYSEKPADDVLGKSIFDSFPEIPRRWFEQKIKNVFILQNASFTAWEHRPFLFRFNHDHVITGDNQSMRQNCTFIPLKSESGEPTHVCIAVADVTETSVYENMLKEAVKSLEDMSSRDSLTGAFNRRHLETVLLKEFSRAKRYGNSLSAVILDIDYFKKINDTYGHKIGDEAIKSAANLVASVIREADIGGRFGGEEFLIILPETDLNGAEILAERLRQTVEASSIETEAGTIRFTVSIGVATLDESTQSHEQLVHNADMALYESKQNQRNCVTCFRNPEENPQSKSVVPSPKNTRTVHEVTVGYR